jgi:hypothetical protein
MLDGATIYDSHVYYVFAELALIVGRVRLLHHDRR